MKDRCGSGHLLSLEPAHCTHILVLGLIKCRAQGSACHRPAGASGGEAATAGPSLPQAGRWVRETVWSFSFLCVTVLSSYN